MALSKRKRPNGWHNRVECEWITMPRMGVTGMHQYEALNESYTSERFA